MAINIIFVCTGNTCRSPMAEGMLKDILKRQNKDKYHISSAGIYALSGSLPSENSVKVMKEIDIDISDHRSKTLTSQLTEKNDLILTMDFSHSEYIKNYFPNGKNKTYLLSEYALKDKSLIFDIKDPVGGDISLYRKTRDQIEKYIKKVASKM